MKYKMIKFVFDLTYLTTKTTIKMNMKVKKLLSIIFIEKVVQSKSISFFKAQASFFKH